MKTAVLLMTCTTEATMHASRIVSLQSYNPDNTDLLHVGMKMILDHLAIDDDVEETILAYDKANAIHDDEGVIDVIDVFANTPQTYTIQAI